MILVDLGNTDWPLLKQQKLSLLEVLEVVESAGAIAHADHLKGLVNWIDYIQDEVVEQGIPEAHVFSLEEEDDEDDSSFLLA